MTSIKNGNTIHLTIGETNPKSQLKHTPTTSNEIVLKTSKPRLSANPEQVSGPLPQPKAQKTADTAIGKTKHEEQNHQTSNKEVKAGDELPSPTTKLDDLHHWIKNSSQKLEMFIDDLSMSRKRFSDSDDAAKNNMNEMHKTRLIRNRTLEEDRDYVPLLANERLNIYNLSTITKQIKAQKTVYIEEISTNNHSVEKDEKLFEQLVHSLVTAKKSYINKQAAQTTQKELQEGLNILNQLHVLVEHKKLLLNLRIE